MIKQPDEKFVDTVLAEWSDVIGADLPGYRNHILRMLTFCLALRDCSAEEQRQMEIAACFHDIGIWTEQTLDYLPPSVPPAQAYLVAEGLESWSETVRLMILEHHKLTAVDVHVAPAVETFRRGDLVDFSLGIIRFGLSRDFVKEVRQKYPNAGFHRMLVRRASAWFVRHPLNPAPMMKW